MRAIGSVMRAFAGIIKSFDSVIGAIDSVMRAFDSVKTSMKTFSSLYVCRICSEISFLDEKCASLTQQK